MQNVLNSRILNTIVVYGKIFVWNIHCHAQWTTGLVSDVT